MRKGILSALFLCLTLTWIIFAQEGRKPLGNSDILEMSKAGLPENTIILAIQKGPTAFDTSTQVLIQLKNQGVTAPVLDAMIRAGTASASSTPNPAPTRENNMINPLTSSANVSVPSAGGVCLIDGPHRTSMKYSTPEMRSNSMLGAVVNPLHKSRIRAAFSGNHAQIRTKNTSPGFELSIASDANPTDVVSLVRLKPKSDSREIETLRGGITGGSSGFRKEDRLPITLEEATGSTAPGQKLYRIKPINPLVPGEYALVFGSAAYYDFGVDAN